MTQYRTFSQRSSFYWVYVAPATILCGNCEPEDVLYEVPRSLREEASRDGLCFLQVLRYIPNARLYVARVAAEPDKVKERPFQVFITEEQLTFTLPWDCRLEEKSPERILAILNTHAKEAQTPERDAPAPPPTLHPERIVLLTPLEEETLIVETGDLQEVIDSITGNAKFVSTGRMQQGLLRAVIVNLKCKMLLVKFKDQTAYLALKEHLRLVIRILRWQRRSHQRVVNAYPKLAAKGSGVVWRLIVGCPDRAILAA